MQLPYSWLKSLFPHELKSSLIADTLTKAGIEVDLIEPFTPAFSGVVVARVESAEAHPDAKKLQLTRVFDGTRYYQVVCGAANCRAGLIVAFAKPGASLGKQNPLVISERAVRGVVSEGMLCSADELHLTRELQEGIIELDESFALGTDLCSSLSDEIFHISLTPNLGHVLSVLGIARELSAFLRLPYHKKSYKLDKRSSILNVHIDSKDCLAYCGYHLSSAQNRPTPFTIQQRLRLSGIEPKSLVVDILNYVMLERGQPMHGFDAAKIGTLKIHNLAHPAPFSALNGKNYTLPAHTLVISSEGHIAAVAGVIGSLETSSQPQTHSFILESACFTPQAVRASIKALDLRTQAANRFEKGIDPNGIKEALDYAASLIMELSGATCEAHFISSYNPAPKTIHLRVTKTNDLLGSSLTQGEIAELLSRLEISSHPLDTQTLNVSPPSYRNDLNIEEDLIEEVGRLYGLEHLRGHLSYRATHILDNPLFSFEKLIKKALFTQGLQEILTCDLLSQELALDFRLSKEPSTEAIAVLSPRSLDQSTLRLSLLSSFIPVIKKNISNKETDLGLFEVGKIHAKQKGHFTESLQAAFMLSGSLNPYYFNPKPTEVDFFDLKGMVENFLEDLGLKAITFKISHDPVFHPYQQLFIYSHDELIGQCGQVHPDLLKKYAIEQKVYYAEFSAHELMAHRHTLYPAPLPPTQPYIERDWTAALDNTQSYQQLLEVLLAHKPALAETVSLLDIYQLDNKKNITVRVRYRDRERSLESAFIDKIHQNFISDVAKKLLLSL